MFTSLRFAESEPGMPWHAMACHGMSWHSSGSARIPPGAADEGVVLVHVILVASQVTLGGPREGPREGPGSRECQGMPGMAVGPSSWLAMEPPDTT